MAKKVVLVAFADRFNSDWVGRLQHFPADAIMLLGPSSIANAAQAACRTLSSSKRPSVYLALSDTNFETVMDALTAIRKQMPHAAIVCNVDAASTQLTAAALAASFTSGAFVSYSDESHAPHVLEPLSFSSCVQLSPTKDKIMSVLAEKPASSLRELAQRTGLPIPLASYHVHGDDRSPGLEELKMLSVHREDGRLKIAVAPMGRMYLKSCSPSRTTKIGRVPHPPVKVQRKSSKHLPLK